MRHILLIMDSTGLKFLGEGEWKCKKHGAEYRRQWRKLHIAIDAETLQIRAVQLTTNNVSDSQGTAQELAALLAKGGEGMVYPLARRSDVLVKCYNPEVIRKE